MWHTPLQQEKKERKLRDIIKKRANIEKKTVKNNYRCIHAIGDKETKQA